MPKRAATIPATGITLDPIAPEPLHRQLYQRLRSAILEGQLASGARLPATRTLAVELGVSRTTVLAAYEQLRDEGYLDSQIGAGTTVAQLVHSPSGRSSGPQPLAQARSQRWAALSRRGVELAASPWRLRPSVTTGGTGGGLAPESGAGAGFAFRLGLPALDAFPVKLWTRLLASRARHSLGTLLGYQDPAGYWPLREAIAAYLGLARGVHCRPEQVIVTGGAQAGLDLAARLLLDPGDPAWMEDPGYYGARGALVGAGARLVAAPLDDQGLQVTTAERLEPAARLAYVTPSHQFPVGVTMSLARRMALLAWAQRTGAFVLEDDYDSEYRYVGRPLPALQGLDRAGRVIYVGSFSKVLFPSLRIGYLVVPHGLVDAFTAAQRFGAIHVPALEQATLADFIGAGHFGRHLRRMRALYAARGAALVRAIGRDLGGTLQAHSARAGMHLVGRLPSGADDRLAAELAATHGIEVQALSAHALEPPARAGLLLGYAAVPSHQIDHGVRRLKDALRSTSRWRQPSAAR